MFLTRLITAIVLLSCFIGAMWTLPRLYWAVFLAPGLAIAGVEWARLAGFRRAGRALFALVAVGSFSLFVVVAGATPGEGPAVSLATTIIYLIATLFWWAAVPLWLAAAWGTRRPLILGMVGWLVLVPAWVALVELQADRWHLLFVLGIVWVADTAAYLAGRRFGRRKLARSISPGKTWEGVVGAAVGVAVYYGLALAAGIPSGSVWNGGTGLAVVGLIAIMSIEGDLFESWIKRQAGVKDSGTLLPGHGGLLDRVDGITAIAPVAALLTYVVPAALKA